MTKPRRPRQQRTRTRTRKTTRRKPTRWERFQPLAVVLAQLVASFTNLWTAWQRSGKP